MPCTSRDEKVQSVLRRDPSAYHPVSTCRYSGFVLPQAAEILNSNCLGLERSQSHPADRVLGPEAKRHGPVRKGVEVEPT